MQAIRTEEGRNWQMYLGDACQVIAGIPDNSIDFTAFSPPFSSLYIYSDSIADMGNCDSDKEFFDHFGFLAGELYRVTVPGRLVAIHCKDLPKYFGRDGAAGMKDFPGSIIRCMEIYGFTFHSRVTIWKDPVIEMQRTKNNGLLHKTLCRDSSQSRQGMADYMIVLRKVPTDSLMSEKPITRDHSQDTCFHEYYGIKEEVRKSAFARAGEPERGPGYGLQVWQRYASPVWFDIDQTKVLNYRVARDEKDEKHICLARDSLVLTKERGYVPIQEVTTGEHALTHMNRWRSILAVQKTGNRPTIQVHAQGVPNLLVTPDHRLWARQSDWVRQRDGAEQSDPRWVEAEKSLGGYVNLPLPETESNSTADLDYWWIVGRWLACGHWGSRGDLHISYGSDKRAELLAMLGPIAGSEHHTGTAYQVRLHDAHGMLRETIDRCGHGASGKHLPPEAFTLPGIQAKSLLDGYLSGDGHFLDGRKRWTGSSVSRSLALGIAFLAQRVYRTIASVYAGRPERDSQIEGRDVHCQQDWILSFDLHDAERRKKPFILDDGAWKKVRSIEDAGEQETWNIRVEEDESYVAEGCVVKNCPLQLDVIARSVELWSNKSDVIFSPFAGIGSEGYQSLLMGRKFIGIELKEGYFDLACRHLRIAEKKAKESANTLFDLEPQEIET